MKKFLTKASSERGTSLLEIAVTVAIMGVVAAMAATGASSVRRTMQADGAMRLVMVEMSTARELAMTQRRLMEVQFVGGNWVRIVRHELTNNATTVLFSVALESGATFSMVPGIPDTPDAFGNGSATYFGVATVFQFNGEGSLIDASGNPINGTVFLAIAGKKESARAVTILGSTGRVRGYRWAAAGSSSPAWSRV